MEIKYVEKSQIPYFDVSRGRLPNGFIVNFINEFLDSGREAALVEWKGTYKTTKQAANNIRTRIYQLKAPIILLVRGEKIYIVRKEKP